MSIDISRLSAEDRAAVLSAISKKNKGKYNAKKTERVLPNGSKRRFDSIKEAERYDVLFALYRAGKITDLRMQVQYTLVNGYIDTSGDVVRPVRYVADFTYKNEDGEYIVEDVKGVRTKEYIIKKKLLADRYGIVIREV